MYRNGRHFTPRPGRFHPLAVCRFGIQPRVQPGKIRICPPATKYSDAHFSGQRREWRTAYLAALGQTLNTHFLDKELSPQEDAEIDHVGSQLESLWVQPSEPCEFSFCRKECASGLALGPSAHEFNSQRSGGGRAGKHGHSPLRSPGDAAGPHGWPRRNEAL